MQSRNQIGLFGVLVLVLLRVAAGWHFFDQGLDKFEPGFSSEGLLRAAKGPLAPEFQKLAHGVHNVDTLLFVAKPWTDETVEQLAAQPAWQRSFAKQKEKDRTEPATPPPGPFSDWLEQITADWEQYSLDAAKLAEGEEAQKACRQTFLTWQGSLANYLSTQAEPMAEYQNELYRLEELKQKAPSGTLPYNDERAAKKYAKTFSASRKWVAGVRSLEAEYRKALVTVATEGGASQSAVTSAVTPTTTLDTINQIVKWSVISIGVCLMLGLCTRLAAVGGALFLCSVIATQPPWVEGASTQYFWYQLVEVCGMLTLAVFGAGQWLGLDALCKHLWRK